MWSSLPTILLSTAFIYTMAQDLFTSVARLKPLISTEEKLIKAAEEYVQNEEIRLQNVRRFVSKYILVVFILTFSPERLKKIRKGYCYRLVTTS